MNKIKLATKLGLSIAAVVGIMFAFWGYGLFNNSPKYINVGTNSGINNSEILTSVGTNSGENSNYSVLIDDTKNITGITSGVENINPEGEL